MQRQKTLRKYSYDFTQESIDSASEDAYTIFIELGIQSKTALRARLALEEVLLAWMGALDGAKGFGLICGKRLNRPYLTLSAVGEACNPLARASEEDELGAQEQNILSALGLSPAYSYNKGVNTVTILLPKKSHSSLAHLGVAVLLAFLCGTAGSFLPPAMREWLANSLLGPLFGTFMGAISAVAGPMIFLSVAWGVYSIGDTATLGKIGKKMLSRFMVLSFVMPLIAVGVVFPFFKVRFGGSAMNGSGFADLYAMILNIVPSNIIKPFLDGNALQIIFIAAIFGLAMLLLGSKTSVAGSFIEQSNYIVQLIMEAIGALVPFFIFTSIVQMLLSSTFSVLYSSGKMLVLFALSCLVLMLISFFTVVAKQRVSPLLLIKKLMPTFIIAITTASSSAAFATNVEACEKKLGVNAKIVNFGVPLGQVVYMPAQGALFMIAALFMGQAHGVSISFSWVLIAFAMSCILAIAAPPIPGGAITCYTILFMQLGIPAQALAITVAVNVVLDFMATAVNLFCLQTELVQLSSKLEMLRVDQLKR